MKPLRSTRLVAVLVTIVSLLFAQLALASYVCPAMATAMPDDSMQEMTSCAGMDMQQPSLCHAHHHADHQSLDKPDLPQVAPFVAVGPVLAVLPLDTLDPVVTGPSDTLSLTHATAPPLAIRLCCFRI